MDSSPDQVERHRHADLELVDAVELLRPRDFVCRHAPGKAAHLTETLAFREECLAAPQSSLGSLLLAQIEHEGDTFVAASFEEGAAEKYRHAAAVFPEVLLLEGLKDAGR